MTGKKARELKLWHMLKFLNILMSLKWLTLNQMLMKMGFLLGIETSTDLSKKYHISREEALITIDICLKYGGYTIG